MSTKKFYVLIIIIFTTFSAWSLSLERGNMKVEIDETYGYLRFYTRESRASDWLPLIQNQEINGNIEFIFDNQSSYNLNESNSVTRRFEKRGSTITTYFETPIGSIVRVVSLDSLDRSSNYYCSVRYQYENNTAQRQQIGLKVIIDTILGEYGSEHFVFNDNFIDNEYSHDLNGIAASVLSSSEALNLYITSDPRIDNLPDRLDMANWLRLYERTDYKGKTFRQWDNLPSSINDSAVAFFWDTQAVNKEETNAFGFILGVEDPLEISNIETAIDISNVDEIDRSELTDTELLRLLLENNINSINELLLEIDSLQGNNYSITQNDIEILKQKLNQLQSQKEEYEDLQ